MLNKDVMTPSERAKALAKGMEVDRLPCNPNIANGVARIYGCKISEFNHDSKIIAKAQMAAYHRFGGDSIRIFTDLFTWAESMGAKVTLFDDATADLEKPAISTIEDIDTLEPSNPLKDGRLPVHVEAMKYLQDLVQGEIKCSAGVVGPFTNAFFLYGVDETLRLSHKNPVALHKLCAVSLETCKKYVKVALNEGLSISISEPMSSCTVISPKIFKDFSLPYLKKLIDYIKEFDSNAVVHICGQTDKIWRDLTNLEIAGLSIDNVANLKDCVDMVGDKTRILGNVDPAGTIFLGTPNDVKLETLRCILDGYDSPKGYTVMSGCSLPTETPIENIDAMMDVVREVGYPVNVEKVSELMDKYSK